VQLAEADAFLQLETGLDRILVFDPEQRWTPALDLPLEPMASQQSVMTLLASGLELPPILNLLQGPYHRQGERTERAVRVWRWVALLGLLAFGLETTGRWLDYRSLAGELEVLQLEASQILTTTFPDIGRVVDPRRQMEQRLAALRQSSGGGGGFLSLLRAIGPSVLTASGLEIRSASYRDGDLTLEVHASSLAGIEAARRRIINDTGVEVALESATTMEHGADARLRISGVAT